MIGARALELDACAAGDKRIFAYNHGIHQRRLVGCPNGMNLLDNVAVKPAAPQPEVGSGETGQQLQI